MRRAPRSLPNKTPANTFPKSSVSRSGTITSFRCHQTGIPSEVFASGYNLKLNGLSIGLKHYAPAHTDSDIAVTFGEADIVHVADTFWNGIYPFIDYSTGGSIDGMIAASNANLAATTDNTSSFRGTANLSAIEQNSRIFAICLL
jgi:glyoxylase-like metal-dependent hydrolase (beta-lactamase superfamily II)